MGPDEVDLNLKTPLVTEYEVRSDFPMSSVHSR
jgi:hypothetical protein